MHRIMVMLAAVALTGPAIGQDIHHHHGMTPEVDRFYSTWLQPNNGELRIYGCCSHIDCYPAEAQHRGGRWWVKIRETQQWVIVPDYKVEHLQPDPRESPDGRNHVCATPAGNIYCFTVGAQI